jgi:hypothetical protein
MSAQCFLCAEVKDLKAKVDRASMHAYVRGCLHLFYYDVINKVYMLCVTFNATGVQAKL